MISFESTLLVVGTLLVMSHKLGVPHELRVLSAHRTPDAMAEYARDAYQRVLCDLTGTASNSGRYGPGGAAEADDFRPLLQIRG